MADISQGQTAAEITRDRDGAIVAKSTATFVRVSDAVAKEWECRYFANGASNYDVAAELDSATAFRPGEGEAAR